MVKDGSTNIPFTKQESWPEDVEQAIEEMQKFWLSRSMCRELELPKPFFKTFMCFGVKIR